LSKRLDGVGIVENEDEVGKFEANLTSKATTDSADSRGRRPVM